MAYEKYTILPICCTKWGGLEKYRKRRPVACASLLIDEEQQNKGGVVQKLMRHFNRKK